MDPEPGIIHTLLIGIDTYDGNNFLGCANDAYDISRKLQSDVDSFSFKFPEGHFCEGTRQHILLDRQASFSSIKKAIDSIASESRPVDTFVFLFAGFTSNNVSLTNCDSAAIYLSGTAFPSERTNDTSRIPIPLLAQWLSRIPCENQIIISEAGMGSVFSNALMASLFENNLFISGAKNRARTIITTTKEGRECRFAENEVEKRVNGHLAHYLLQLPNLAKSIVHIKDKGALMFESELISVELECKRKTTCDNWTPYVYSRVYEESKFRDLFLLLNSGNRGFDPDPEPIDTSAKGKHRKIALVVATNKYESSSWSQLRNPINDGRSVAKILSEKYGYEVDTLYNQKKDSILETIYRLKTTLDSTDEVIVFFAGHGYYNSRTTCGHIVPIDGLSPSVDQFSNSSYLHWYDLKSMFDAWPARNVFVILDVCFGGKFDPIAPTVAVPDYASMKTDLNPIEFHDRKTKYFSRLFLASGSIPVPDYWKQSQLHSPFADKLIKSLNEGKGFVTPAKIYQDLQMNITEPVLRSFGRHDGSNGDFVLVPATKTK